MNHLRSQNPDLKLVVTADGAGQLDVLKASTPTLNRLSGMPQAQARHAAFGYDENASIKWFKGKRNILRHDPNWC